MINDSWPWWADLYVSILAFMAGMAAFMVIIGIACVAIDGRNGWNRQLTVAIISSVCVGLLWPVGVALIPFIALYRAVTDR